MTKVTVAPITSTIKGLSSEILVGPDNGLDHNCVVALDNAITVPVNLLGRTVGYLTAEQEARLARGRHTDGASGCTVRMTSRRSPGRRHPRQDEIHGSGFLRS